VSATWSFPPEIGADSPWPIFERVLDYPELASQAELARDHEVRWAFVLRREMGEDGMWLQGQRRILGMACMPRVQGVLGGLFGQLLEDALDYLPDFLIVLDRSWWEASTDREREILVFHELLHCGQALDGQGAPKFRRSDKAYIYLANADWHAKLNPLKDSTPCPYSASPSSTTKPPLSRSSRLNCGPMAPSAITAAASSASPRSRRTPRSASASA
jgi:hypothetical protein